MLPKFSKPKYLSPSGKWSPKAFSNLEPATPILTVKPFTIYPQLSEFLSRPQSSHQIRICSYFDFVEIFSLWKKVWVVKLMMLFSSPLRLRTRVYSWDSCNGVDSTDPLNNELNLNHAKRFLNKINKMLNSHSQELRDFELNYGDNNWTVFLISFCLGWGILWTFGFKGKKEK